MPLATDMEATEPEAHRVLLIDLENCPHQIHQLMQNLERFSRVIICYAQSGAKIPLDWLMPLTSTVNSGRLNILKMPSNGKNAADFGITFWAGALMQELPPQTHFTIVSEDTDLDHVIKLLIAAGRTAERVNTKKEDKSAPAHSGTASSAIKEYCAHLIKHSKNRPVKKATLINHIKSGYKTNPLSPEDLIAELTKQGAITVTDAKVSYNETTINRLAN